MYNDIKFFIFIKTNIKLINIEIWDMVEIIEVGTVDTMRNI